MSELIYVSPNKINKSDGCCVSNDGFGKRSLIVWWYEARFCYKLDISVNVKFFWFLYVRLISASVFRHWSLNIKYNGELCIVKGQYSIWNHLTTAYYNLKLLLCGFEHLICSSMKIVFKSCWKHFYFTY